MAELVYVRVVSEACKDDNHLDCIGRFQDGETEDGRPIWRKCDCDCGHPAKFRRKSAEPAEWREISVGAEQHGELPYATHEGVLTIGDYRIRCYRLSTGQAVFEQNDLLKFLGIEPDVQA